MDKRKKIRRASLRRHLFQAAFFALTNGYVQGFAKGKIYKGSLKNFCVPGLNCYSCPGAFGACPIGSLQAVLDGGKFRVTTYVLGLLMAFGALLGRFVCGWLCPFGLVQELLHKIPLFKKRKNLPGHRVLKYLPYFVLIVFVLVLPMTAVNSLGMGTPWFCAYICPSGTLLGGIPLLLTNPALRKSVGWLFARKLALLVGIILLSVKSYRPFCKYLCPLGAIYGCFNPISFHRMKVDSALCTKCGACQAACGMDLRVWETPNHTACIRCGKCKAACPQDAITSPLDELIARAKKKRAEAAFHKPSNT